MKLKTTLWMLSVLAISSSTIANDISTHVPMTLKDSHTFYVSGRIAGFLSAEFMVDTGSSYMTINQTMLNRLTTHGQVEYLRDLTGVLANGEELVLPVYRIASITLGDSCELRDIEAAVFPGDTRQILGLSALRKAAPFMFSTDPPELHLSNCRHSIMQAQQ